MKNDRAAMLPFALLMDLVWSGAFWGPNRLSTAIYATDSKATAVCRSCSDGAVRWSSVILGTTPNSFKDIFEAGKNIFGYATALLALLLCWTDLWW